MPKSWKASLFGIFERLETTEPELFEKAIRSGLDARPPYNYQYLQLWAHYREGKPTERVELTGAQGGPIRQIIHRLSVPTS